MPKAPLAKRDTYLELRRPHHVFVFASHILQDQPRGGRVISAKSNRRARVCRISSAVPIIVLSLHSNATIGRPLGMPPPLARRAPAMEAGTAETSHSWVAPLRPIHFSPQWSSTRRSG